MNKHSLKWTICLLFLLFESQVALAGPQSLDRGPIYIVEALAFDVTSYEIEVVAASGVGQLNDINLIEAVADAKISIRDPVTHVVIEDLTSDASGKATFSMDKKTPKVNLSANKVGFIGQEISVEFASASSPIRIEIKKQVFQVLSTMTYGGIPGFGRLATPVYWQGCNDTYQGSTPVVMLQYAPISYESFVPYEAHGGCGFPNGRLTVSGGNCGTMTGNWIQTVAPAATSTYSIPKQ